MTDNDLAARVRGLRRFAGILGWSNKRTGIEFYRSWDEGRWAKRDSLYDDSGEPKRGGWGRLLADDIERAVKGRAEGSDVLVLVGSKDDIATLRALIEAPAPAPSEPSPEPEGLDVETLRLVVHDEYEHDDSGDRYYGCRHVNQHRSTWDCAIRAEELVVSYLARLRGGKG